MKNFAVDNSLKNLGKAVLWQYDRAVRLLSIMKHMQVLFFVAIQQFWAKWIERVLSIDTSSGFGCLVWSILLGLSRPSVAAADGTLHQIAPLVYRRLLKGKYYLTKASPSAESIQNYLEIVFGIPGRDSFSKWIVSQCEYGWKTNIDELNSISPQRLQYHVNRAYDEGEVFHFKPYSDVGESTESDTEDMDKFNWIVTAPITAKENKSWEAVSHKVAKTSEEADLTVDDGMILLKLYDPNGICRKIAGAPRDALSIRAEYIIGDTTISATVTRRRKSGVAVIDDGGCAMHYEKTEFFSEMHKDQQALFEQKMDEVCPYPLGIKSNAPVEEVVFAFDEQQADMYKQSVAYPKGAVFSNYINDGIALNWECVESVSATENISFEAIKGKLKATNKGAPIVGTMCEDSPFDNLVDVPSFSTIMFKMSGIQSQQTVSREQWPSLSLFYPPSVFLAPNGWMAHSYIAFFEPSDRNVLGRNGNMDYVYRIPLTNTGELKEVTDGLTYTAFFGVDEDTTARGRTIFALVTKELADEAIKAMQHEWTVSPPTTSWDKNTFMTRVNVALSDSLWGGYVGLGPDVSYYEKLGLIEAMGKAAKAFKWPVVGNRNTFNGALKTSFISNSTLKRIGQGGLK